MNKSTNEPRAQYLLPADWWVSNITGLSISFIQVFKRFVNRHHTYYKGENEAKYKVNENTENIYLALSTVLPRN